MKSELRQDDRKERERWLEDDFWANPEFADRAIKAAQEVGSRKEWISLDDLKKERAAGIEAARVEGAKSPTIR